MCRGAISTFKDDISIDGCAIHTLEPLPLHGVKPFFWWNCMYMKWKMLRFRSFWSTCRLYQDQPRPLVDRRLGLTAIYAIARVRNHASQRKASQRPRGPDCLSMNALSTFGTKVIDASVIHVPRGPPLFIPGHTTFRMMNFMSRGAMSTFRGWYYWWMCHLYHRTIVNN
jgi:hypothetical protein